MIKNAIELIKHFEGFKPKPYLCPAGIPTIGYGSTRYENGVLVTLKDAPITKERAEQLMMHEVNRVCVPAILRLCPPLIKHENKLCAIISFTYNLGTGRLRASTLRRRINQELWNEAEKELLRWNKESGKVSNGLVRRREAEAALFRSET